MHFASSYKVSIFANDKLFCIHFRHVANGEILGVSLLMEDILQSGYQDLSTLGDDFDEDDATTGDRTPKAVSRRPSAVSHKSGSSRPQSAIEEGEPSTEGRLICSIKF